MSSSSSSARRKRPAALPPRRSDRRRRTATAAAAADPWASLPEELIRLIGWRVLAGDLLDYVRFRAAAGHGLHPGHTKLRGHVRLFNLSSGAFLRVRLPQFKDYCVLDSVDGVLVLQRDRDTAVRLLHPFTGDVAVHASRSTRGQRQVELPQKRPCHLHQRRRRRTHHGHDVTVRALWGSLCHLQDKQF
ncbi:hypothetical protein ACP4OV_031737 [Aristida adscensionis]